jgi:hypothetical protein
MNNRNRRDETIFVLSLLVILFIIFTKSMGILPTWFSDMEWRIVVSVVLLVFLVSGWL